MRLVFTETIYGNDLFIFVAAHIGNCGCVSLISLVDKIQRVGIGSPFFNRQQVTQYTHICDGITHLTAQVIVTYITDKGAGCLGRMQRQRNTQPCALARLKKILGLVAAGQLLLV